MKKKWVYTGILVVVVAFLVFWRVIVPGGMLYSAFFAYPEPAYYVDTYVELQEKIAAAEENYLMPDSEALHGMDHKSVFTVLLKDRFHDDPAGYYFSVRAEDEEGERLSIDCELIEVWYKGIDLKPTVEPTEEYKGVGLQAGENFAKFIYNGCYYNVNAESTEHALEIAKSMIDQIP